MSSVFDQVRSLNLPAGKFAIFGSGPIVARGLRDTVDVDVIVTDDVFDELAKDPSWVKVQMRDHHDALKKEGLEIYHTWAPGAWDIDELIKSAEMIDGLPFVQLDAVVEWKTLRDEGKDKGDLELIEKWRAGQKA